MGDVKLHLGDCTKVLPRLPDASVDALVTDPPAGIAFMGKEWDDFRRARNAADVGRANVFGRTSATGPEYGRRDRDAFVAFLSAVMAECLRVLRPGSYGLVWAIPRTSHWTATALEDAGFEIRDRISYLFGQGFPKAKSCLKPACEDWWLVRKPDRRVGPLPGLDVCRIATAEIGKPREYREREDRDNWRITGGSNGNGATSLLGRWPANVVLDEEAAAMLDEQTGPQKSGGTPPRRPPTSAKTKNAYGEFSGEENPDGIGRSAGCVSRFFYCPKASRADRNAGCEGMEDKPLLWSAGTQNPGTFQAEGTKKAAANNHPTVKPLALMRWLCRLVTPPGGMVLDPFLGSGSTGRACVLEGFRFVGIEQNADYHAIAKRRIAEAQAAAPRRLTEPRSIHQGESRT